METCAPGTTCAVVGTEGRAGREGRVGGAERRDEDGLVEELELGGRRGWRLRGRWSIVVLKEGK